MWRRKSVPARLGEELVPEVHGRAPRAPRRALNRLTRRQRVGGTCGPSGSSGDGETNQDNQRPKYHAHDIPPYTASSPDATWTEASRMSHPNGLLPLLLPNRLFREKSLRLRGGPVQTDTVLSAESLARLNDLKLDDLRAEWKRLYRSAPPRLSRDLMKRAIAYTGRSVAHCVVSEPYVRAQTNHDRVVHIRQPVI